MEFNSETSVDAMKAIGITSLESSTSSNNRYSKSQSYMDVKTTLSEPQGFLDNIPETRGTFIKGSSSEGISNLDRDNMPRGCCATPSNDKCTIF